ncbi:MAG: hypothetical protein M4579_006466 [Chaenotheca gracillima]|nr:MAG: hypothetical protein M4579_006466 [Chaenotheca gracillima]
MSGPPGVQQQHPQQQQQQHHQQLQQNAHSNGNGQHQVGANSPDRVGPGANPFYENYASMSTLASAAQQSQQQALSHAHHHQQQQHHQHQPQYMPGQHDNNANAVVTNAAFSDLDAHLGLYGDLEGQVPAHAYGGYDEGNDLGNAHMNGDFGQDNQDLNEWYGQQIDTGLPGFLDGYQNVPVQPPPPPPQHQMQQQPPLQEPQQQPETESQPPPPPSPPAQSPEREEEPELQQEKLQIDPSNQFSEDATESLRDVQPDLDGSGVAQSPEERGATDVQPQQDEASHPMGLNGDVEVKPKEPVKEDLPKPLPQLPQTKSGSSISTGTISKQANNHSTSTASEKSPLFPRDDVRPKSSIPTNIPTDEYARQCIIAAYSSRLNPFALHPGEHKLLRSHLNHLQVTTYLNIRNGLLRLWMRNPLVSVTREEALGCAKDYRWFNVANVAYQWLVRMGYINFGCVEVPTGNLPPPNSASKSPKPRRQTVVVIGAGMAGLGCARQLEGLFAQYAEHWTINGQEPPKVRVLEGRGRIGGRVYSHPLKKQAHDRLPADLRCTAEMGAHIITGFDHGNPLNAIIRGQLALHYHSLKDNSILYDSDGTEVDKEQDQRVEKLFNDVLDRVSIYRHKAPPSHTAEGARELIELGRDPAGEGGKTIAMVEDATATIPAVGSGTESTRNGSIDLVPVGLDKLTGKAFMTSGPTEKVAAINSASTIGWKIKPDVDPSKSLQLDNIVQSNENPTLGNTMDEGIKQYQAIVELNAQDMRLLNWHYANLEYANAANLGDLSLGGWDQDIGNEFEGEHAQIVGGYLQVPRGLWQQPTKLDVQTRKAVKKIVYSPESTADGGPATIECSDGEIIEADAVVSTLPLGILKESSVQFEPALPDWKLAAIDRLGFGTLNKVVLVYDEPFWDEDRDMFGVLRDPVVEDSLNQPDYSSRRGRFYLFWNCIKTSGRPVLVALMAGDAAHQTETSTDDDLIAEATYVLGKLFSSKQVPEPTETIVTRWGKDKFARGSYSYVGSRASSEDYDLMAKPAGNLHFAGEATCGTHPATVHGAYLSGLRAASDVAESLLGPIEIPSPFVAPKVPLEPLTSLHGTKRKAEDSSLHGRSRDLREARLDAYEGELSMAMYEKLGERPLKPGKTGANPFLLYQKSHWYECKHKCDEARRQATKNPEAKASRNEVRAALGQMWREAPADEKRPYLEQTASNKEQNATSVADFKKRLQEWDQAAVKFRKEYEEKHPCRPGEEELKLQSTASGEKDVNGSGGHSSRRVRKVTGYAEESDDEDMAMT